MSEPYADAGVEAMHRAIHDGAAFLEECGRDLMAASAHAAFRRLGIVTGDWETVDAARLYTFALKSALATVEAELRREGEMREQAVEGMITYRRRAEAAEAERDQWKAAAESTLRAIDRIADHLAGTLRAPTPGDTPA